MLRSSPLVALAMCSLFFAACGGGAEQENAKLQAEVLKVHDDIMPLMGSFTRKSIQIDTLLGKLDSLKAADPALDTVAKRTELVNIKLKLDEANEAMESWMQEFEPDHTDEPADEVTKYLEGEKAKVDALKRQFDDAKVAAEKL